jgi:hypothetical protein
VSNAGPMLYPRFTRFSRKEVDFEGGKVLLSRIGDDIRATSAFCTHYGAPLAKGVLTSDGRVVWYVFRNSDSVAVILTTSQPVARRYELLGFESACLTPRIACFNVCSGDIGTGTGFSWHDLIPNKRSQRMLPLPLPCTLSKLKSKTGKSM